MERTLLSAAFGVGVGVDLELKSELQIIVSSADDYFKSMQYLTEKISRYNDYWRNKTRVRGKSSVFLREVIGVIPTISVDVNQCEAVVAEDTSVILDAVGKIAESYSVHLALFAIKPIAVSRCEKERRAALDGTRDTRDCRNRILGTEMEHDAPSNRSIENTIGKRTVLNHSSNRPRFGAIVSKVCQHRA